LGFFVANSSSVFAYSIETHAFLTDEIIKFYNQNFSNNKIPDELKDYLIDGSRREDDIPRWMNHFYDPVKDRGLTRDPAIDPLYNLGTWQKSKDWAQDSTNQNSLIYKAPATIASILTAIQQRAISALTTETDFTWQRAIKFYVQGEKEKAMFILGHILHLIEDKSVPDHTRNDPHAQGSPYEIYSQKYNLNNRDGKIFLRLANKKPVILQNLESYFKELALYSNNNFYSKDTLGIQSGYELPQPDYMKKEGDYFYGFKIDKEDGDYKLFIKEKLGLLGTVISGENNISLLLNKEGGDKVLIDYWSRLSTKSIQYGAGVINLFFQEVEKAKNDPNFTKQEEKSFLGQIIDKFKNLTGQVISVTGNAFSLADNFLSGIFKANQNFQPAGEITLSQTEDQGRVSDVQPVGPLEADESRKSEPSEIPPPPRKTQPAQVIEEDEQLQPLQKKQTQLSQQQAPKENLLFPTGQATTTQQQAPPFKECKFSDGTNKTSSHQKIIINEIAWMGTFASANDEWIELKNIFGSEVDLTGWQLIDQGEQIKINFGLINKTRIPAGGFILLERTDDNSVPNTPADLIYTGAISNTSEGLRLFDNQCNLIDEVLANPDWPAGDNTSASERKTMERDASGFGWRTSSVLGGTPKAENSQPAAVIVSVGGGGGGTSTNGSTDTQQASTGIRIAEIMYNPVGNDDGREWLEIFNTGNSTVNLDGWKFYESGTNHSLKLIQGSANLNSGAYAIVADDSAKFLQDYPQYTGALFDSSFSLSNTGETIAVKNGDTIIDEVSYNSGQGANGDGNSLQLVNNEWRPGSPTPGAANQVSQNEAPGASFVNYLLISEVYPDKTGKNFDFVELYNPTNSSIALKSYSLKILKAGATSTDSLASFSASNNIASKSFFLIGFDDYSQSASAPADISRSSSFLPTTQAAKIILYNGDNSVDEIDYNPENLSINQSFERKAWQNNSCVSSQNNGEFLGNGCDSDSENDFETRQTPNPQNSQSFPEPRNPPTQPANFPISYSTSTMELIFNWQPSQDYSGAATTLLYKITDISNASSTLSAVETSSTTAKISINEVGRDYNLSIQAFDKEGLGSETTSSTISVPSFLKEVYFYRDPRHTAATKYLLEFTFNSYPFLPDARLSVASSWPPGNNWKAMVFYFNQDALKDEYMHGEDASSSQALLTKYHQCNGSHSGVSSLVLPDTGERCLDKWQFYGDSIQPKYLEDNRFLSEEIFIPGGSASSTDYITIAYYGFERTYPQGFDPLFAFNNFKLIAVDKVKYHFQNESPPHQPPTTPSNIQISFNNNTSELTLSFPTANITDPDTADSLITYQFNYTTSSEPNFNTGAWQSMSLINSTTTGGAFETIYNNSYIIGGRAVDDFNNFSDIASGSWSFPADFIVIQQQNIMEQEFNGSAKAAAQVFKAASSGFAKSLKVITHGFFNGTNGTIQAFLYNINNPHNASGTNLLASSTQKTIWGTYNTETHTLIFENPPFLEQEQTYTWVVSFSGLSSNLKGANNTDGVGGSGWARYGNNWESGGSYNAANNYYFILRGSTSL
jgi:hypothetical protein